MREGLTNKCVIYVKITKSITRMFVYIVVGLVINTYMKESVEN